MSRITQKNLLAALIKLADGSDDETTETARLRHSLLEFGSETPDNLACAERIGVGTVEGNTGLALLNKEVLFRDLAHVVEDGVMPDEVREAFPHLDEDDWSAFTRMTTLIYILLGSKSDPDGTRPQ